MPGEEQRCGHEPCTCEIPMGQGGERDGYCSSGCADAAQGREDVPRGDCPCSHPGCAGRDASTQPEAEYAGSHSRTSAYATPSAEPHAKNSEEARRDPRGVGLLEAEPGTDADIPEPTPHDGAPD